MRLQLHMVPSSYILSEWNRTMYDVPLLVNEVIDTHVNHLASLVDQPRPDYFVNAQTLRPLERIDGQVVAITDLHNRRQISELVERVISLMDATDLQERIVTTLDIKYHSLSRLIADLHLDVAEMTLTYRYNGKKYIKTFAPETLPRLETLVLNDIFTSIGIRK